MFFNIGMELRLLPWLFCFGMGSSHLSQLQSHSGTGSCSVQRVVLKATKAALRAPTGAFCSATSEERCTLPGDAPCLQPWLTLAQFLACIPTCNQPRLCDVVAADCKRQSPQQTASDIPLAQGGPPALQITPGMACFKMSSR